MCNVPAVVVFSDIGDYVYFVLWHWKDLDPFTMVSRAMFLRSFFCRLSFVVDADVAIPRFLEQEDVDVLTYGIIKECML